MTIVLTKKVFGNLRKDARGYGAGPSRDRGRDSTLPSPLRIELPCQAHGDGTVEPKISGSDGAAGEHRFEPLLDHVVVPATYGLPSLPIPEHGSVALVWNHMVGNVGRRHTVNSLAPEAERMLLLEQRRRTVERSIVTTITRAATASVVLRIGLSAAALAIWAERRRANWHLYQRKKAAQKRRPTTLR